MLRKTVFALSTAVALSAATSAPTSAFAGGGGGGGWHGGGWHGGGFGFGTAIGLGILAGAAYDSSCMAQRVFQTPNGPVMRWVNVCY
jgi:hypothetical protein